VIRLAVGVALLSLLGACATAPTAPAAAVSDLAPTGKLRAAINFGNPILATKDAGTGEPRGVSVDLSRELAKRLRVPVELVTYDAEEMKASGFVAESLTRHRIEGALVGPPAATR
jgi:polar amino acid transport system substrate-binding protein